MSCLEVAGGACPHPGFPRSARHRERLRRRPGAEAAATADARVAIVLGNAPAGTDEPTAMQTARCLKAFELYKSGAVNTLLVTGGFTRDYISEARMMKIALVTYGVAPDDVLEEELAATTIENGLFAARMFDARGWPKTATIVSQAFHLPRAGGNYKQQGFEVKDAAAADAPSASDFAAVVDATHDVVAGPSPPTSSSSTSRTPPPTRCRGPRRSSRAGCASRRRSTTRRSRRQWSSTTIATRAAP